MTQRLTTRETLFCHFHTMLGNGAEAALQAGYPACNAAKTAARLLERADITGKCAEMARHQLPEAARRGLLRMAFGTVGDAVSLLLDENFHPERLAGLDLYCISEIKRLKDGGLEMKFHDRLRALELLSGMEHNETDKDITSLCTALEQGAQALRTREPDAN